MKTIKGPGIFLAQFAGDDAPFNTLEGMANWAARLGFAGMQIPSWDKRLFDLKLAAESQDYCDEVLGKLKQAGLALTELSTHLQGQLVASHPAYDVLLDGFAPPQLAGDPKAASSGPCSSWSGLQGEPETGAQRARDLFRRAGVAFLLSLAAAAGGAHRRSVQGTGPPLAADPADASTKRA